MKPLIVDLYCGVGGATKGYQDAGFDVYGVDMAPQPDYCGDGFLRQDALTVLEIWRRFQQYNLQGREVAAIHASPPCQASSALTKGTNAVRTVEGQYPQLIPQTRALLEKIGLPYVIENVQGAEVRRDLTLCGEMFGLDVIRHRYFECSFPVWQPAHVKHRGRVSGMRHGVWYEGPYAAVYGEGGGKGSVARWQEAMGIDWTERRKSIAEAIPPAYAECVGAQLMKHIAERAVV